jgi:hypothetical protein
MKGTLFKSRYLFTPSPSGTPTGMSVVEQRRTQLPRGLGRGGKYQDRSGFCGGLYFLLAGL